MFYLQWKEFQENVRHSYKEVKHESILGGDFTSLSRTYKKKYFFFRCEELENFLT